MIAGAAPAIGLALLATMAFSRAAAQPAAIPLELQMPGTAQPVVIYADSARWDRESGEVALTGSVEVSHPLYRVYADSVLLEIPENVVRASGNVRVVSLADGAAGEVLTAEEIMIEADRGTGWLLNSRLKVPLGDAEFSFQGKKVTRLSENRYLIEDGIFTWCRCGEAEKPDWSVGAEEIKADLEGDAEVRGGRVYLRGVPAGYVPYFRYPVGTSRRSGFLMPEVETAGSDGVHLELPYFQTLGRSADATFYPRYIQERGFDAGGEVRYNLGPAAEGALHGFGIDDVKEKEPRGGVRLRHRTEVGPSFTAAADLAWITDNEVLFDFDHRDLGDENARFLQSSLYLSAHRPDMNLTTEFAAFDDLMGGDLRTSLLGEDRDEEMIQRLPALTYTLLTTEISGPLVFDLTGSATNYYRQERDLGRGRLYTLRPRAGLSGRLFNTADFFVAGGYRGWFASPDPDFDRDTSVVGRPEAELFTSLQVARTFDTKNHVLRHLVRPWLVGFYRGEPERPNDDFFAPFIPQQETALAGLHLDSRLMSRPKDSMRIRQPGRAELTQLYDFQAEEWRDLRVEAELGEPAPWRLDLDAYYSWEEGEWSRVFAVLGRRLGEDGEVSVGYRYDSGLVRSPFLDFVFIEDETAFGSLEWRPHERHLVTYRAFYSLQHDIMIRQTAGYQFLAKQRCWALELRGSDRIKPEDPDEHELSGSINLRITQPFDS